MEKDLVPLVDVAKRPVFQVASEAAFLERAVAEVRLYCEIGIVEPQRILDEFSKYQFLFERN